MKIIDLVYSWVCIDDSIDHGMTIDRKVILINLRKLKFNLPKAKPKNRITVTNCHLITDRKVAQSYGLLKEFDLLIYRDDLSSIIN